MIIYHGKYNIKNNLNRNKKKLKENHLKIII